jgi:signal peptidase I
MLYTVSLLLFLFLLRQHLTIITVCGRSMEPTLFAGDRVLLLRLRPRRLLRPRQLVVCRYAPDMSTNVSPGNKQVVSASISGKLPRYIKTTTGQPYYIKRLWGLGGDRVVLPAQDVPTHHNRQTGAFPEQDEAGNFVWHIPALLKGTTLLTATTPPVGGQSPWTRSLVSSCLNYHAAPNQLTPQVAIPLLPLNYRRNNETAAFHPGNSAIVFDSLKVYHP